MSEQHGTVETLIDKHGRDPHRLVQLLRDVQAIEGWLPREALASIAAALSLSLADVEGVAGFYRFLHTRPVGRTRILFSDNITDRMLGSEALMTDLCGLASRRANPARMVWSVWITVPVPVFVTRGRRFLSITTTSSRSSTRNAWHISVI